MKGQREWLQDKKISRWLSQLSFEEKHSGILSKRHPGTGEWLLSLDRFKAWRNGHCDESSILWCPGIPGAGKSVMTSIIIESIQKMFHQRDVGIAYIYCDYKDRKAQTTKHLVCCLVKQLISQLKEMPQEIRALYKGYGKGDSQQVPLDEYFKLLSQLLGRFGRCFILIDALDDHFVNEDSDNSRLTLMDELLKIHQHRKPVRPTLFFTSRENPIIEDRLKRHCIRLDIRATDSDIKEYLNWRIQHGDFICATDVRKDAKFTEIIIDKLVDKAKGMFLLPRLHLDKLSDQTNLRSLRQALESLPTELNPTYDDAMARIQRQAKERSELAFQALSWISNACRPLQVDELQHALAIQHGDKDLRHKRLVPQKTIIDVSSGLITVDAKSREIRLVHSTAEEYFEQRKKHWFPKVQYETTKKCLTYLLFDSFRNGFCLTEDGFKIRQGKYRFFDYAARNWAYHAREKTESGVVEEDDQIQELAINLLSNYGHTLSSYFQVMMGDDDDFVGKAWHQPITGLGPHIAAYFCLKGILVRLLETGITADCLDHVGRAPLSWAARNGAKPAVELLINRNDVNADLRDENGRTPLSYAARWGQKEVVKLLIERDDVEANSKDAKGRTALSYAADWGHKEVVSFLISRKDVVADLKDKSDRTPLSYAVHSGHREVVNLLIDRTDVEADSVDTDGRTPLSYAAAWGYKDLVNLLISRGDVAADLKDKVGRTPFSYAANADHMDVVNLLIDRDDVEADSKDINGRTILSYAAGFGHTEVLKLLVGRNDVARNSTDSNGRTPVSHAAQWGHVEELNFLLGQDDVRADSKDINGQTPLSHAAHEGRQEVVKILLDRNDVVADSRDKNGLTPQGYAEEKGHKAVVQLLITALSANSKHEGQPSVSISVPWRARGRNMESPRRNMESSWRNMDSPRRNMEGPWRNM